MSSPLRGIVAVSIAAFFGCQVVDPLSGPPALEVTTLFVDQTPDGSHALDRCLKELARSYADDHDGVLFFDKTSKIRVTPPRRDKSEPYHVHVLHRVAGRVLDNVVRQDSKGLIDVDVSRFEEPEALVVTSAALHLKEEERPGSDGTHVAEGVAPAYTMSLKLVPSELWEPLVKLQHFRTELATPQGDLYMFTQSFNRRDMFLSWLDPAKNLRSVIEQDPYVYLKPVDAYLPPRLSVQVSTGNAVWQRAGTWPLPEWIDRLEGDAARNPFVFRTAERELFSFGPPARLDLTLPKDPVASTARIDARFTGVGKDEALRLVLACAYPLRGKSDYAARVQTHDIAASNRTGSYTVSLEGLEPGISFPLTAAITHRFLNPWRTPAGMYRPVPPRQRVVLPALPQVGPRSLHSRVVLPRYASHYDFLAFFGDGRGVSRYRSIAEAYHGRPGNGPSPNIVPPPPGPGTPPTPPPGSPPGPSPGGTTPGGTTGNNPTNNTGGGGAGLMGAGGNNGPNPPPGGGMPGITITLKCPGKGGCGMNNCTCPNHMWTQSAVMNGIWQAFAPTGPADISFFGAHGASAPCHKVTKIAVVRVTYWGVGFQLIHVFYQVSVTFQPCMGVDKPPPPPPLQPPPPGVPPVGGPGSGGSGSGGAAVVVVTGSLEGPDDVPLNVAMTTTNPGPTIPLPYSDPGFMAQGGHIRNALGGDTLPTWVFVLNDQRIAGIASGFGLSYYGRPVGAEMVTSVGWNPNLSESWGIYQPTTTPGGSSGGSPPPPTCDPSDYYCTGQTKPIR